MADTDDDLTAIVKQLLATAKEAKSGWYAYQAHCALAELIPALLDRVTQGDIALAREKAALKAVDRFAEDAHQAGAERDQALRRIAAIRATVNDIIANDDEIVGRMVLATLDGE